MKCKFCNEPLSIGELEHGHSCPEPEGIPDSTCSADDSLERALWQRITIDLQIMENRDNSGEPMRASEVTVEVARDYYRELCHYAKKGLQQNPQSSD